jgi:hypothetical protein
MLSWSESMSKITFEQAVNTLSAALADPNHNPEGFWKRLTGFDTVRSVGVEIDSPEGRAQSLWGEALYEVIGSGDGAIHASRWMQLFGPVV